MGVGGWTTQSLRPLYPRENPVLILYEAGLDPKVKVKVTLEHATKGSRGIALLFL
jgi:hypothetical protein